MADYPQLRALIHSCPVIDNHAHPLLLPSEYPNHPFESITTEAQGSALQDTFSSLSHLRAVSQLKELYGWTGPDEDWNWRQLLEERQKWLEEDLDGLIQRCLQGTYSIMMDDGLGDRSAMHPFDYHDQFTQAPTKRLLRIETLAESIMEGIVRRATEEDLEVEQFMADTFLLFSERFEIQIDQAIDDPNVAGFKSVICYRSGLDVEPDYETCLLKIGPSFEHYIARSVQKRRYRVDSKHVNDFLVLKVLEILSARTPDRGLTKPVQFHTGLGDNDIELLRANPAYMQPLIEAYPTVPFVILHSAYPYTREAGYLTTVFKNVYLDVGLVFPMLSHDGEITVISQALELTPFTKLLWSTDGHLFPETYWLANKQFRAVLEEVLIEYVNEKDLTETKAMALTADIMFNTSNYLYDLGYPPQQGGVPPDATKVLPLARQIEDQPIQAPSSNDTQVWTNFMKLHPETRFVFTQWLDYMGTIRSRIFPAREFDKLITSGKRIPIAQGNTGTLQNDGITPAVNTTGQIYIEPDPASLRPAWHSPAPAATVMACWCDVNGKPIKECARCHLKTYLEELSSEYSINLLVGFEIECIFLRRIPDKPEEPYAPLTTNHAWSTMTPEQWTHLLPIALEIADALESIGITMPYFHSESAQGQYEFILPPLPPVQAIDTLYQARQVIATVAESHGLRVTLHPHPIKETGGSGAHAHISLNSSMLSASAMDSVESQFWAGVLAHLEAICAFALPEKESYERVVEDHWTSGVWIAWGTQNREVPLRKADDRRWELRSIDGFANMYLVINAVVAAGLLGLKEKIEMTIKDSPHNPARLIAAERVEYGITRRLPQSLEEALEKLEADSVLKEALAEDLVKNYVAMKESEQEMLKKMSDIERRVWLIERY